MSVPVADPTRWALAERQRLEQAFTRVVEHGRYVMGQEHDSFEREFGAYLGVEHCIGVASGTDALELSLRAIGCVEGDEVVVAANAGFYASAAAVAVGMDVRYADVDPHSLTLTAATLEPALTPATRAVVVTHLYGVLADVSPIADLCRSRGIGLVEDCAQAAGAKRNGQTAGSFGDVAAFSFYPTKNLGALGDGGAVATSDDAVAARVRSLRQYGWEPKYRVTARGGRNSRLDELQASILRTRLPSLDAANERRRAITRTYAAALEASSVTLVRLEGDDYVAHLAVVLVDQRDQARTTMAEAGVVTDVHYPVADHRQPVWGSRYSDVRLPVTESAVDRVLSLPCFPELTEDEVGRVCEVLREL